MQNKHPLQEMLEPMIENLGYEVVRIMTIGQVRQTLQIMIERIDRTPINVEDCAKVSRAVSEILDEKDPIEDNYSLEVSSPGLDRPLTKLENFVRFNGNEAKIETSVPVEGRKRFKGKLLGVENNNVKIEMDGIEYAVPFEDIAKAKLVLTDEMLAQYEQELEE